MKKEDCFENAFTSELMYPFRSDSCLNSRCVLCGSDSCYIQVDLTNGVFTTTGCDVTGDIYSMLMLKNRMTFRAAKTFLESKGVQIPTDIPLSLVAYCAAIGISEKYAVDQLKLSEGKSKYGTTIDVPFFDVDNNQITVQKITGIQPENRKIWQSGVSEKGLYGVELLHQYKDSGDMCILILGVEDTHILRYAGFPVIGVPIANMMKRAWAEQISCFSKIYILCPDNPDGEVLIDKTISCLFNVKYTGQVLRMTYGTEDYPDLRALAKSGVRHTVDELTKRRDEATVIDVKAHLATHLETIPNEPIHLLTPSEYSVSVKGIYYHDEKKGMILVCRSPITIVARLKDIDLGVEMIQIAFYRDNCWHQIEISRSELFASKPILSLADRGFPVTSENAKSIIQYLGALESENFEMIPISNYSNSLGWRTTNSGKAFIPYCSGSISLRTDQNVRQYAAALSENGSIDEWATMIKPYWNAGTFEMMIAASFAASILRIVGVRNFIVHTWTDSRGGKTAALKAAASVWGHPEGLLITYNATAVAMERLSAFFNDFPVFMDERQEAGGDQRALDSLIYMLANGVGRARGNKAGGMQETVKWRTITLSTGEEPLDSFSSKTGVTTRLLQLYGKPFADEKAASQMHISSCEYYGTAGHRFIQGILENGDDSVKQVFKHFLDFITNMNCPKSLAHLDYIATLTTADYLANTWIMGMTSEQAEDHSLSMAQNMMRMISNTASRNVNEDGVDYLYDWISTNAAHFGSSKCPININSYEWYGYIDQNFIHIVPSILSKALKSGEYSPLTILRYMDERILIIRPNPSDTRLVVRETVNGQPYRFYKIRIRRQSDSDMSDPKSDSPDDGFIPQTQPIFGASGSTWKHFNTDDDLPF